MASSKDPSRETAKTRQEGVIPGDGSENALQRFGQCASILRDQLYDDRPLDEAEFLFMDNHVQALQIAYLRWKRRHRPSDSLHA